MGQITRPTKTTSGTSEFADDKAIEASEWNADINPVYQVINGNLDVTNVPSLPASVLSNKVAPENVDDTSGDATEQEVSQSPGNAASRVLATNVEDELQQLRYGLERLGIGTNTVRQESGEQSVSWAEDIPSGPNLIINGNFGLYSGDTSSFEAPDGWVLVGDPDELKPEKFSVDNGSTFGISIVADAASEGIKQTVVDLKGATRYLIVIDARSVTGTWNVTTSNADTNEWDDVSDTITVSASFTKKGYVIKTDATPTDIVIQISSQANNDDIHIREVSMRELGTMPSTERTSWTYPAKVVENAEAIAATQTLLTDTTTTTDMSQDVVVPGPGYEVEITYSLQLQVGVGGAASAVFELKEDSTGLEDGRRGASGSASALIPVECTVVRTGLAAGTYTYEVFGSRDSAVTLSPNITIDTLGQTQSKLICRVRKRGA